MSAWTKQPGDKLGLNWRIPNAAGKRAVRHVVFDTNFWKSFINSRLMVRTGDPACLTLYGRNPHEHRLFAEHLTAEFRVKTFGRGRVVDEWKQRPNTDNHWFDCLVGCAVAANLQGASLSQMQAAKEAPKKRISLAELQRRRRSEA
jgi:phage terminase large subunit GpA-like protein